MTDREKLIELVCDAMEDGCIGHCNHPPCYQVESAVNRLIANGVTVQDYKVVEIDQFNKWIPVAERLPEKFTTVLIYDGDSVEPGRFCGEFGFYTVDQYESNTFFGVTHWMPLPQPPKEVKE